MFSWQFKIFCEFESIMFIKPEKLVSKVQRIQNVSLIITDHILISDHLLLLV